jgi:vacuolar-type H+-ATPase subunit C/Vma6
MHTWIKTVNGHKIYHWTLGDVYYIQDNEDWIFRHKELKEVEKFANQLKG